MISMTPQQQNIRRVIQWNPHQGLCGNTMTVIIEQQKVSHVPQMKLVFGMHPVETTQQHQIISTTSSSISSPSLSDHHDHQDGRGGDKIWITLIAKVPPQQPGNTIVDAGQVPLSICVYENDRVDQWAFGTFTYDSIHHPHQQQQQQQYNQDEEHHHHYQDYSTSSTTETPDDSGLSAGKYYIEYLACSVLRQIRRKRRHLLNEINDTLMYKCYYRSIGKLPTFTTTSTL